MTTVEYAHPQDSEAARLVSELSDYLRDLTGDDGRGGYDVELFNADKDAFVVLRFDEKPVACGAIRFIDRHTCEIKRMFSKQKGMGTEVLHVLENKAKLLGYTKVILATRKTNSGAVRFYLKHGYRKIAPYGKYGHTTTSICLGKHLYPQS